MEVGQGFHLWDLHESSVRWLHHHYSVREILSMLPLFKEVTNGKQDSWHL